MKLEVLAFGKLKNAGYRETANRFLSLISPWSAIEEIELKSSSEEAEKNLILTYLEKQKNIGRITLCLLDERGKAMNSMQWSKLVGEQKNLGIKKTVFCIGGSYGFHEEVRKKADYLLSFGPQTLSHELCRIVLFEQIYRSLSILEGHPYHHETRTL